MEAFATITDLEERWRPLDSDEQETAQVLLLDAAYELKRQVKIKDDDEDQKYLLKVVSCNMVRRVMSSSGDAFGRQSESVSAGPYSQSVTYYNPSGDMYLTKREKQLLGIGTLKIGSISPYIGIFEDNNINQESATNALVEKHDHTLYDPMEEPNDNA